MTVATQANLVSYLGDDIAVTFPFTFPVFDETHLLVLIQDTTTLASIALSSSDYSVTGIGNDNGGSVVTDTPPATGTRIILARVLPFTQDLDVDNQGGFYPRNFERQLDIAEMQTQQLNEEQNRSIRGPSFEVTVPGGVAREWPEMPLAPIRRNHLIGFEDTDEAFPTIDTLGILFGMLVEILRAGFGIELVIDSVNHTITIVNTAPGGAEQEAWLLEDASGGGGGGGGAGDAEFVLDTVAAALIGAGLTVTYDDPGNTITLTVTGSVDIEQVYDAIAAAITAGTGILVSSSDVGNTTTISADPEFIRDTIGATIVGGVGITSTVDDAGNTITLDIADDILDVASAATVTPTFAVNSVHIRAQAAGLTIANPTGMAVDGHGILIRIKDNGTPRAITWGAQFRAFNDALPTTTTANKTMYVGVVYNATDTKWDVLGVRQEP